MIQVAPRTQNMQDLWISYANEYLGKTNYLSHNKIVINYNRWCSDQTYRGQIASELNIKFTDQGFNKISSVGGGSSFDGVKYNESAFMMDISGRWKNYTDDDRFLNLINDKKLARLSLAIFEHSVDLKTFSHNTISQIATFRNKIKRVFKWLLSPLLYLRQISLLYIEQFKKR
jgi:hypothetical protein